jgi:hypothetical protein
VSAGLDETPTDVAAKELLDNIKNIDSENSTCNKNLPVRKKFLFFTFLVHTVFLSKDIVVILNNDIIVPTVYYTSK